jgi:CSLREA domain-containing protein
MAVDKTMWTERARTLALFVLALLVAALVGVFWATLADAATFTVNSTADPGTDGCDATECTLREAITAANDNEPTVHLINFAIPGAGPHTISPASDLPPITEAVTINGYSESLDETTPASANTQAVGSNAVLKIELDGTNVSNGLRIWAANSTVKGLIINRFSNVSVWITGSGATGNKVEGNFIGTDASGTVTDPDGIPDNGDELGNLYGVYIEASNNTIGGTTAGAGNIISGNGSDGVEVSYYRDSNDPDSNDPTPPTGNRILSNSIYDNDALGIDLVIPPNELPGVTNNDPKDPDTGPNRLQNFPKLTSATTDTTTTTITGMLNSRPRKSFTIQFFSSPEADPSGRTRPSSGR